MTQPLIPVRCGCPPAELQEFRIVELASSELWNLGCNSVLLREAVMARLLQVFHELLLFSCMAAFVIGVVIAAASIFG
jgi:hypothetical protein